MVTERNKVSSLVLQHRRVPPVAGVQQLAAPSLLYCNISYSLTHELLLLAQWTRL